MKCEKCGQECNIVSISDGQHKCSCQITNYKDHSPHEMIDEIQSTLPSHIIVEVEDVQTYRFTNTKINDVQLIEVDKVDMFLDVLHELLVVND